MLKTYLIIGVKKLLGNLNVLLIVLSKYFQNVLKYICPKLNVFVIKYFASGKYLYLYSLSTFKVLLPSSGQHRLK